MALSDDNVGQVGERHPLRQTPTVVSATTYTITEADVDRTRIFTAAGATTVTIPTDAATIKVTGVTDAGSIPLGSTIKVATTGAGGLTVSGAGVTFTGAALTGAQNVTKELVKIGVNAWFCLR